ncbi:hypothetical protein [Longilinea arvoryzae]|uniref:hypothetical protein n=1 Tax=Longilinea arvoryzae TaxID=360412 RepID=UPI0012601464|nr:hypothetical protein [Longilinea arvoryzae]
MFSVITVSAIAFILRHHAVDNLPNDYDEWVYLTAGRNYASAIQNGDWQAILNSPQNYEHPIFNKLVYAFGILDLDLTPVDNGNYLVNQTCYGAAACRLQDRARWISTGFGVLAAGLLALVSPLAGLLLAVHTFAVKYTSVVYLEALPACTSLVAVLAYAHWLNSFIGKDENRRWGKIGWLALSALMLGVSAASKYLYAVVGIVIVLHFLLYSLLRRQFRIRKLLPLAAWGIGALVIFFLCDPYLWPDPIHRLRESLSFNVAFSQGDYVNSYPYPFWQPLRWLSRSVTTFKARYIPQLPGNFPVALDGWILWLAILGFPRLVYKRPLYALWFGVGMAFLLVWTTKWPQYVLIVLAPWCFSAGEGLVTLFWLGRFALGGNKEKPANQSPVLE